MPFSIPSNEVERLREMYEQELSKTLERLSHIEAILSQLNSSPSKPGNEPASARATVAKSLGRPKARKGKKRGPRSVWGNFVLKRLKDLDKPLTYEEMVKEAMTFANVGPEKEKNIRQSIINTTFRLRTVEGDIDTFSMGNRIKYLALKDWFDDNGQIRPEYAKKSTKAAPKKTRKRRKTKK